MCPWMGSHFHEYGVAFSRELLEWVAYFRIFQGKTVLTRIFALYMKSIVLSIQSQKMDQFLKIESD